MTLNMDKSINLLSITLEIDKILPVPLVNSSIKFERVAFTCCLWYVLPIKSNQVTHSSELFYSSIAQDICIQPFKRVFVNLSCKNQMEKIACFI